MEKIVFVLGLPGSGKSTAAHHIQMLARDYHWIANHFSDYGILKQMFLADSEGKRFSSAEYGGFDIHDLTAFDDALYMLEDEVLQREQVLPEKNELIIIEFARNDYCSALKLFSSQFLQNASFLFIDADISVCIERIQKRVADPRTPDDHYVSNYIFESYYQRDNRQYLITVAAELRDCCDIADERIQVIENTRESSLHRFLDEVSSFVLPIFEDGDHKPEPSAVNSPSKDTSTDLQIGQR